MNYFEFLKKRIKEFGFIFEEIVEKIENDGFVVGKGYISRL